LVVTMEILEAGTYISFIAGALFAVWQLYDMRRDRKTQLVLGIMEAMSSRENQEMMRSILECESRDAKEIEEKCGRNALFRVGAYFEGLDYLLGRGLVDREPVFEVMTIAMLWKKMKPWVLKEREKMGKIEADSFLEHFEQAAEMKRKYHVKTRFKGADPLLGKDHMG
jgi:hypothetical protein